MKKNYTLALIAVALASASSVLATDVSRPIPLTPIIPCRLVDTRRSDAAYPPPYGAPGFGAGEQRTIPLALTTGTNPCVNAIPAGVSAIAANFTIVSPGGSGDLRVGPGSATPTSSVVNFFSSTIANAVTVPASSSEITLRVVGSPANVLVDVFGYYANIQKPGTLSFDVRVSGDSVAAVSGTNETPSGTTLFGVYGAAVSADTDTAGVVGISGTSGFVVGDGLPASGVKGIGAQTGVSGRGNLEGVHAQADGDPQLLTPATGLIAKDWGSIPGLGVSAWSFAGTGVSSTGAIYGTETAGTAAPIRLVPAASGTGAPSSGTHQTGELYVDSTGALFYCRAGGSPGTWVTIAP
jgi:hypothetical protein